MPELLLSSLTFKTRQIFYVQENHLKRTSNNTGTVLVSKLSKALLIKVTALL